MTANHCRQEGHGVFATALYEPDWCRMLLERIRDLDAWNEAEVSLQQADGSFQSRPEQSIRSASILDAGRGAEVLQAFDRKVSSVLCPLVSEIWRADVGRIEGTQLIRYRPGGHYSGHSDSGGCFPERYFTVVCYLNDDFQGGTTTFPSLDYRTQPQSGKAILFPSRYFHVADPVTSGEKFVLITWLCGPVPIRWL